MKKVFIKLICLLLVFVTLLPLIAACKDDDPPPQDPNDTPPSEDKKLVSASLSSYNTMPILNLEDFGAITAVSSNRNLTLDTTTGKSAIKWTIDKTAPLTVTLPQPVNENDYYYIEFSVYSEGISDTVWNLGFTGYSSTIPIKMDFSGWRKYQIKQDAVTVKNPTPNITAITFTYASGAQSGNAYITSITATNPVYTLTVPDGINITDKAIYEPILANWTNQKTANNIDSSTDSVFTNAIAKINSRCESLWADFKATYDANVAGSLFGYQMYNPVQSENSDYGYSWQIRYAYENLAEMARAYACKHSTYYGNADLLSDIKKGLEYLYKYGYGEIIATTGVTYGDWYPWDVSIPLAMLDTVVLIRDKLTQEEINKYVSPFDKLNPLPYGQASNLCNMARNVILSAALQQDAERLMGAYLLFEEMFVYLDEIPDDAPETNTTDGFYTDGSFIQHEAIPYQGGYGFGPTTNGAQTVSVLMDSVFEPQGENVNHLYEWIFEAFIPIIQEENFFIAHSGRLAFEKYTESDDLESILIAMIRMASIAPATYKTQLESYLKYFYNVVGMSTAAAPLHLIEYANKIKTDDSIPTAEPYQGAKVYGNADIVVQHTPEYAVCLSMASTRIMKYESINDSNETGWYHHDGAIYIYTDGYDFGGSWMPYANPYLIPGTTVNLATRNEVNLPGFYGSNDYAGGASQGNLAVAGYILGNSEEAYTEYWTTCTFTSPDAAKISAKKSYFMFDNEIVCLGTDIHDVSGAEVVTVVDNRRWGFREHAETQVVTDVLSINGQAISSPATAETTVKARTMHFTNMGGYVFLNYNKAQDGDSEYMLDTDGNTVSYRKATLSPLPSTESQNAPGMIDITSEADLLEITINHGTGDGTLNGKYAYVYLPEASVQETEDYYANPDVKILKRNGDCHAVLEKTLGCVAANIFKEAGSYFNVNDASTGVTKVTTETSCSLIITKTENGEYIISASDPTHTFRNVIIEIEITGVTSVVSKDAAVKSATVEDGVVRVVFDTTDALGASFSLTVK